MAGNIQIDDRLLNKDGLPITVDSIEWQAGKFKVYNLRVDRYPTFIADNIWVNNKKAKTEFGEMIFTHFGLSGPIILTLSRFIVDEVLKDSEIVENFYFADPRDGGFGKTIVRLKA